jgi:hypothetical protein
MLPDRWLQFYIVDGTVEFPEIEISEHRVIFRHDDFVLSHKTHYTGVELFSQRLPLKIGRGEPKFYKQKWRP